MRVLLGIVVAGSCLLLTACAGKSGMVEEFGRSTKAYNRMLRWQEIESAGMIYLTAERRENFLAHAATLKKQGLSITDFRIISSRCLPEKRKGDVVAEFDYILMPSNTMKTISYHLEWSYQEKGGSWQLDTMLPPFE